MDKRFNAECKECGAKRFRWMGPSDRRGNHRCLEAEATVQVGWRQRTLTASEASWYLA